MDTTVINELWRPLYGDLIQGFQVLTPEWDLLKELEGWKQFSEREIIWPVDLRFGGGVAATEDGGSPARAMSNNPVEATEFWAWYARRFQVSMAIMKSRNSTAFKKAKIKDQLRYQTMDALFSFQKRVAIGFYGFEDNILALVDSAVGAPTYTLKDRYGRTGLGVTTEFFTPGNEYVAIIDPAGPTERGRALVTSVNEATPSITTDAAIAGAASGDYVVFANHLDVTAGVNDLDLGFPGMLQHIHGTSLHGIAESSFPEWTPAIREDLAGAALAGPALYEAFTQSNRRSGHNIDFAMAEIGVIAQAGGTELDKRRYQSGNPGTLYLGFEKLVTMGVTVEVSEFVPPTYFIADATSSLRRFSPDSQPWKVKEGGEQFHYYGTALGYFCDILFRIGLMRYSRKSLVAYWNVKNS